MSTIETLSDDATRVAGPDGISSKAALLLVALVLCGAAALRCHLLTGGLLFIDEAYSVGIATKNFTDILHFSRFDPNPPLGNALYRPFVILFGPDTARLEFVSVVAGLATIGVTAYGASLVAGRLAAVFAALFLSISVSHLDYSQYIRVYSVSMLLMAIGLVMLLRYLARGQQRDLLWSWIAFYAFLNTHYLATIVVASIILAAVLCSTMREQRKALCLVLVTLFLAFAPIVVTFLLPALQVESPTRWVPPFSQALVYRTWLAVFGVTLGVALVTTAMVASGVFLARADRARIGMLLGASLLPVILGLLLSWIWKPMYGPRYACFSLVPTMMLAGIGAALLSRKPVMAFGIAAAVVGLSLTPMLDYFAVRHAEQRLADRMSEVDTALTPGQVVLHGDRCSFSDRIIGKQTDRPHRLNAAAKMSKALRFIVGPEYLIDPLALRFPQGVWVVETHCAIRQTAKSIVSSLRAAGFGIGRDLSIDGLTAIELTPGSSDR